ncbi:hypothetical protein HG531_006775 [Fusarium graminearum]|nr:hypothetical protein HG531_006775 [Fusarium graminearum]
MVDESPLPWYAEILVRLLGLKERDVVVDELLLHVWIQDDGIPGRLLCTLPELSILFEVALIKHPYFIMEVTCPRAGGKDKLFSFVDIGCEDVEILHVWVGIRAITAVDQVDNKFLTFPLVEELAKDDLCAKLSFVAVHSTSWCKVDGRFQGRRKFSVVMDDIESGVTSTGISQQITLVIRDHNEFKPRILFLQSSSKDGIGVDSFGGGVLKNQVLGNPSASIFSRDSVSNFLTLSSSLGVLNTHSNRSLAFAIDQQTGSDYTKVFTASSQFLFHGNFVFVGYFQGVAVYQEQSQRIIPAKARRASCAEGHDEWPSSGAFASKLCDTFENNIHADLADFGVIEGHLQQDRLGTD